MPRTSHSVLQTVVLSLYACVACVTSQQATDHAVLTAIGDHGDRISDLEIIVKELKSEYQSAISEIKTLKTENVQLRTEIEELNNRTDKCCISKSSGVLSSSTPTTVNNTRVMPNASKMVSRPVTTNWPLNQTTTTTTATTLPVTTTQTTTTTIQSTTMLPTTLRSGVFKSCDEAHSAFPTANSKIVEINVGGITKKAKCQFEKDGNWLLIQHREDGSVDFNRKWTDYRIGFGDPSGELWIGNDFLHKLTNSEDCTLQIDFSDWASNTRYAKYQHFSVGSLFDNYRLSVGSYSGTAGDSFHYPQSNLLSHHQMMFSTPDRDYDRSFMNCADKLKSGWWFNSCYSSNLNGKYMSHAYGQRMLGETNGDPTLEGTGIEWYPFRQRQYSFKRVTMKVKLTPRSFSVVG